MHQPLMLQSYFMGPHYNFQAYDRLCITLLKGGGAFFNSLILGTGEIKNN